MSDSVLTPLQEELLAAFFRYETGFFLTGGAALAGFYLGHRTTEDLDLFATDETTWQRGRRALAAAAGALDASLETVQDVPGFARFVVTRGADAVVVDLVLDRAPQQHPDKSVHAGIRVDPIEEIVANKLTTVVSRAEPKDLVDLMVLEDHGHRIDDHLAAAYAKDGGCTPATVAWVLSEVEIPDAAELPGGVEPSRLRAFIEDLVRRLGRVSFPAT